MKSNIGKQEFSIPNSTLLYKNNSYIYIKGKLGILRVIIFPYLKLIIKKIKIRLVPIFKFNGCTWGTYKCMLYNMLGGITVGYQNNVELFGLGFRASVLNFKLILKVGFSHEIIKRIPSALTIKVVGNTQIFFKGVNQQSVNSYVERIYKIKTPDPYKGKGIRYHKKILILKEGKKKK